MTDGRELARGGHRKDDQAELHIALLASAFLDHCAYSLVHYDVAAVRQAVQKRTGQPGVAKDLGPFGKGKIRGHNQRATQVLLATSANKMSCWLTLTNNASRLQLLITPSMVNH